MENDDIVLTFDGAAMTKAADTDAEAYVNHVDVLIFNSSEAKVHHERVVNNGSNSFTLAAKRSSFGANVQYYVYLVANSNAEVSVFNSLSDIDELRDLEQEDNDIMFANVGETKHNFLMDAVAYTGNTEPSSPGTVILNDGVLSNSTYLKATFRRAAAKVHVTINKGTEVIFADAENNGTAAYYMRNCPSSTTVIDGYKINPTLVTPNAPAHQNTNFVWTADKVEVVAYAYEYNWENQSIQDKETSLVVNIPMMVDGNVRTGNWYKVPLSETFSFERNHIYTVEVTVNALGATSKEEPMTLDDLKYNVVNWADVTVDVGGDSNKPAYLQLNTNHVDMYNVNQDNTTLEFASSSEITSITLLEAYYYNYLDQQVDLSVSVNDKYNIYSSIEAEAEEGVLNGGITIISPFVGLTDAEKAELIAALEKPMSPTEPTAPTIPSTMPVAPSEVQDPGEAPDDPNSDAVLNEIADKYSSNNGWYSVTVTWTTDSDGNVIFSDDRDMEWNDSASRAQAEYESLVEAYEAYNAQKAAYDAYLIELASYEAALAEWKTTADGQSYMTEWSIYEQQLTTYESDYASYLTKLETYEDQVQAINNGTNDSHSNAIRYLKFEVQNSTGQTAQFTVAQYPTLYITNEHGHYSYRSDFGGTTYYNQGANGYNACDWNNNSRTWSYARVTRDSSGYLFRSKFYNQDEGDIDYYYWSNGRRGDYEAGDLTNPRMYHVHVTSTSARYIVSRPRLDADGYTESSEDNSKLVSPSFMIASQLGATQSPSSVLEAKSHCAQYVEVKEDGTEYSDWRLPTAAEVEIIIQHQYVSDAMAEVMSGMRYWCAYTSDGNNYVSNPGGTGTNTAVRCVRDSY